MNLNKIPLILSCTAAIMTFIACEPTSTKIGTELPTTLGLPIITTIEPTDIKANTASSGGSITSDGGASVTARGICWSVSVNPSIASSKTSNGAGIGTFTSSITNLTASTIYFIRAYATNSNGTAYGSAYQISTPTINVSDIDGNIYHTVTIGTQTWMVENLNTTRYRNGSSIPNITDNTAWCYLTTGAWCNYNSTYESISNIKYGKLYNWYTVNDTRNIAPAGWHVATDQEWTTLKNYVALNLGNSISAAKGLASNTDWVTSTATGTIGCDLTLNNSFGFNALPGGYRQNAGVFNDYHRTATWWCSTEDGSLNGRVSSLGSSSDNLGTTGSTYKFHGRSVRCIKDN